MANVTNELRETTMTTATPFLAILGAKLNSTAAWFLSLFGLVTWDFVIGLTGVVLGIAGYMLNRRYKKKEIALKRAREERDQISWEMSMIERYGDKTMIERYGPDWGHSGVRRVPATVENTDE